MYEIFPNYYIKYSIIHKKYHLINGHGPENLLHKLTVALALGSPPCAYGLWFMEIVVLLEYQSGHNMGSQSAAASVTFTLSLSPNIGYCFVSSWLNKDAIMREHRDVKI